MAAIEMFLKDDARLPSPPAIAMRILEAVRQEDASFAALARIISADPALSARILKVANSSVYAPPKPVDSLEKALSVLGVDTLKNIALSFVIAREVRGFAEGGFDFERFWRRAVTAAVAAELLAKVLGRGSGEIFVTALLQDLGIVLMYLCRPEEYLRVLDEKLASGRPVVEVEQQFFDFDHAALGETVLRRWGLPETICAPIAAHHAGRQAPEEVRGAAEILSLSDRIASVYHGSHGADKLAGVKEILCKRCSFTDEDAGAFIDEVAEKTLEILGSFEIDPGRMKPYSQLLQDANEELGKLNLSYEQLLMEYKQAKERAEHLAAELKGANQKLRELAFRDGLTGLYNHRYFQDALEKELQRAVRHGRPLSLILFDIDHFKKVNDTYGHPRGDLVLRTLGTLVRKMVRTSDIVARYGGEEFAIILPETSDQGAATFAERLRQRVAAQEISAEGDTLKITISLGVVAFPGEGEVNKAWLVKGADQALYNAKRTGRNRVSVARFRPAAAAQESGGSSHVDQADKP